MADKIKGDVKFSNFEYQGFFSEPVFEIIRIYGAVEPVYAGLKPLNVTAGDVKYKGGVTTPNDPIISFELAKNHYTLTLALAGFSFKADYVAWEQAPVITDIIEKASAALKANLGKTVTAHHLQLVMQFVPSVPIKGLTQSLLPTLIRAKQDVDFSGFILHTKTGVFVLDKSAIHDNGMFVRIVHRFDGPQAMEVMAKAMYDDEAWLADTLGIEFD
jgi:hypothetical protein